MQYDKYSYNESVILEILPRDEIITFWRGSKNIGPLAYVKYTCQNLRMTKLHFFHLRLIFIIFERFYRPIHGKILSSYYN